MTLGYPGRCVASDRSIRVTAFNTMPSDPRRSMPGDGCLCGEAASRTCWPASFPGTPGVSYEGGGLSWQRTRLGVLAGPRPTPDHSGRLQAAWWRPPRSRVVWLGDGYWTGVGFRPCAFRNGRYCSVCPTGEYRDESEAWYRVVAAPGVELLRAPSLEGAGLSEMYLTGKVIGVPDLPRG